MAKLTVGTRSTDPAMLGKRDAFHVPGVVVFSRQPVEPGSDVRFVPGANNEVIVCGKEDRQAVVDPFIDGTLLPGQGFWIFLCPEIVGNLIHHFEIVGVASSVVDVKQLLDEKQRLQDDLMSAQSRISILEDEIAEVGNDDEEYDECSGCYS